MAQEEIKLVGSFDDKITKKLQNLNREITNIGRSFKRFNKKISPISKNFAKMAKSAQEFSNAMSSQRNALVNSSRAMREYSKQARKVTVSMRKVTEARMKAQRQMGMSRAEARASGGGIVAPVATGQSGGGKGGASFGVSAGQSFTKSVGAVAIGSAIGNMASNAIMNGVRGFRNLLKAPFDKFLGAFNERIGDEMDDIKSAGGLFALDMDLTQESGNEKFFKNYNESLRFQEKLNIDMAESAAALPGVTSQYVSTSRQLTDTIQMVMEKDRESFNKMAARYGADISQGGVDASKNAMQTILKKQTEQVVLQSQGQKGGLPMHIAIQQLMGKEAKDGKIGVQAFTNKFRAAFQKNPLLKNFLLRAEKDLAATDAGSVERLQKIIEVFDAAMPKQVINKMRGSLSGMMEALRSGLLDPQAGLFGLSRAVFADVTKTGSQFIDSSGKLLKKNVNDFGEFIYKFSEDFRDTAGIAEELGLENTTNLNGQELTLKQLKKLGLSIDKQNRIVDEQGKVYGEISKSNTYLFEAIREILAGFGPPLLELVGFLPALFDPFTQMTTALLPLRDKAQEFVAGFNNNIDVFEEVAQAMAGSADAAEAGRGNILKQQSRGRAAIGRFVNFLEGIGGIDKDLGSDILKTVGDVSTEGIQGYDKNIVKFIEPLFRSILESDFVKDIAKGAGQIVAGIIRTTYEMITGVFSLAEGGAANALVEGFTEGFGSMFEDLDGGAGGAIATILKKVTDLLSMAFAKVGEILVTQILPMAGKMVIDTLVGMIKTGNPVGMIIGALGLKAVGGLVIGAIKGLIPGLGGLKGGATSAAQALNQAAIAARNFARGAVGTTPYGPKTKAATAGATSTGILKKISDFFVGDVNKIKDGRAENLKKFGEKGGALKNIKQGLGFKNLLSAGLKSGLKMGAVGGIIKSVLGLISGKSPLDAISEGLAAAGGSAIGAAIGTIIFPGIGTAIGGLIGGFLGDNASVIEGFKQALMAVGSALGGVWESLSSVFQSVGESLTGIFNVFGVLMGGAGNEIDTITAIVIAVKIALTPIVAGFQLLAQAINLVVLLFHGLKFTFMQIVASILTGVGNALGPFGGKIRELGKVAQEQADLAKSHGEETVKRMQKQFETDSKFYQTKKVETQATKEAAAAMTTLRNKAKAAGSTFENNEKFQGEDGKFYGWAKKDGKDVLVEWGSVATEQIKQVGEASKKVLDEQSKAAQDLKESKEVQAKEALNATVENGMTGDPVIDALRRGEKPANTIVPTAPAAPIASERQTGGERTATTGENRGPRGRGTRMAPVIPTPPIAEIPSIQPTPATPPTAEVPSVQPTPQPATPDTPATPPIPTPEETGVASVIINTEAALEPAKGTYECLAEIKTPVLELPMKISEALSMQTMELSTIIGTYLMEVGVKLDSVVAALATEKEDTVKLHPTQVPLAVKGNFGGGPKVPGNVQANWMGNVQTAASGMNLGRAIATEMKHKPAGSDLVIANSSETIIPAGMTAELAPPSAGMGSTSNSAEVNVGGITVNVSGIEDPKQIANQVAEELMLAIQEATHKEIFSS